MLDRKFVYLFIYKEEKAGIFILILNGRLSPLSLNSAIFIVNGIGKLMISNLGSSYFVTKFTIAKDEVNYISGMDNDLAKTSANYYHA